MALLSKENVVLGVLLLPLGIAVNAVFLWGVRDIVDLKNPLFWVFQVVFQVLLYKIGKRADRSRASVP